MESNHHTIVAFQGEFRTNPIGDVESPLTRADALMGKESTNEEKDFICSRAWFATIKPGITGEESNLISDSHKPLLRQQSCQ